MNGLSVVLMGPYPPPPGGIANHVQRLHGRVADIYSAVALDLYGSATLGPEPPDVLRCGDRIPGNLMIAVRHLRRLRARLVHIHVGNMHRFAIAGFFILAALPPGTRTVLTIHGGGIARADEQSRRLRRWLMARLVSRIDHVIVVNEQQRGILTGEMGIDPGRVSVIPAFLPPQPRPDALLDQTVSDLRANGKLVLLAAGGAIPAYGFHLLLDAIRLSDLSSKVALVYAFYGTIDPSYASAIQTQLASTCDGVVLRNLDSGRFAHLLSLVDGVVRPTDRDGDAVLIREALHYDKPVIASDCVERPSGVRLFTSLDARSLADGLVAMLDGAATGATAPAADFAAEVLGVYADLLATR